MLLCRLSHACFCETSATILAEGLRKPISDTNYFMLAEVAKRATKNSLADFLAENIFKPLGIRRRYHVYLRALRSQPGNLRRSLR